MTEMKAYPLVRHTVCLLLILLITCIINLFMIYCMYEEKQLKICAHMRIQHQLPYRLVCKIPPQDHHTGGGILYAGTDQPDRGGQGI